MPTFDEAVAAYLAVHHTATNAELTDHLLALAAAGDLDETDREALDRAQRRGAEGWTDLRLRQPRVRIHGVSTRRFVALLTEGGGHSWADIQDVIGNPALRAAARAHAYSVIAEAASMAKSQRRTLRAIGDPMEQVDDRIREIFGGVFEPDADDGE